VTTAITTLNSTEKEWVAVIPAILTVVSSFYVVEDDKKFVDRGGTIRFITDITYLCRVNPTAFRYGNGSTSF